MPFELFTRSYVKTSAPKVTISGFGRIALNKGAADLLTNGGAGFVVLWWDKQTRRIAIQSVPKETDNSYPLKAYGEKGKTGTGFSAVTFLNYIDYDWSQTRSFGAEWKADETMIVVVIPQELLSGHKKGAQPTRRQARPRIEKSGQRTIRLDD